MTPILTIDELRERWHGTKYEILVPAALSDATWQIFHDLRRDLPVHQHRTLIGPLFRRFREITPVDIASFKSDAEKELIEWAKAQTKRLVAREDGCPGHPLLARSASQFARDISRMHATIFVGSFTDNYSPYAAGGFFKEDESPDLHRDVDTRDTAALYVARLNALPTLFARSEEARPITDSDRILMDHTLVVDHIEKTREARRKLLKRDILRKGLVGRVYLFAGGIEGDLHCSSVCPPKGKASVLFRANRALRTDFSRRGSPGLGAAW